MKSHRVVRLTCTFDLFLVEVNHSEVKYQTFFVKRQDELVRIC